VLLAAEQLVAQQEEDVLVGAVPGAELGHRAAVVELLDDEVARQDGVGPKDGGRPLVGAQEGDDVQVADGSG